MKREMLRLHAGLVVILAVLLAFGVTAAAYADEGAVAGVTGSLTASAPSKGAVAEESATSKPPLAAYDLTGGSIRAQDLDDDLPGVPLTAMPVTGTLDAVDTDDIYSWSLAAGQTITVSLTGDSGTDFDLWLLAPDGSTITSSRKSEYPELITYRVPSGAAGTYYIPVQRYLVSGDGAYELNYGVDTDSELRGTTLPLPAKPVCGLLDARTDICDAFNVYLWAGQTLSAALDGASGTDFDLFVFAPGSTSWRSATPVADTYGTAAYPDTLSYVAPTTGTYYLIARAYTNTGSGWYYLTYSRPLKTGTFQPVLSISTSKLRVGRTLKYWGTVYPTTFSRNRMVLVQKRKNGRWVQSRWIKLDGNGKFPKMSASYNRRTTQYIRLYMPAYVDTTRGINYKAGYSAARKVRWY